MVLENPEAYRIKSSQSGPHRHLDRVVQGHLDCVWAKPIQPHNREAFERVVDLLADHAGPLVMDSGCGDGSSTRALAERYPRAVVLGVDKSAHRLPLAAAAPIRDGRVVLARADLVDFWRLARRAGWRLQRHYLLYPNPWPKPGHLKRRWHAHPVWPALLGLGGTIELRSNWRTYVEEFAAALAAAGVVSRAPAVGEVGHEPPISPFERKYRAAGSRCYRLQAALE